MEIDKSVETLIRVLVEKIEALETDNCLLRWERDNLKAELAKATGTVTPNGEQKIGTQL